MGRNSANRLLSVGWIPWACLILMAGSGIAGDERHFEQRLRNDLPQHPRVLWPESLTPSVRERIDSDLVLGAAWGKVRETADAMLEVSPVEYQVTGRRLLTVSRQCLKRVLYLGTAWRLTGDRRYLERAEREMLAAADFPDWNPSHFLDVAEMTAALAIGYDWLRAELSGESRRIVKSAVLEKGLKASFEHQWPVSGTNNWTQVCHAGLVLGGLALADEEPELAARVIARAVHNVPGAMEPYAPDGAYPEGPSYWVYGTTYNVLLIDALERALGEDFGLFDRPGFPEASDYLVHATGPSLLYFNYSDGVERRDPTPAQAWFARRRGEPGLARYEEVALRQVGDVDPEDAGLRFLPLMLLWADRLHDLPEPASLSYMGRGSAPVAMHRSGWEPDAVYVGLKGGTPGAPHGHMDIGQFVLDAEGVRWSVDLGLQSYHGLEALGMSIWDRSQESDRWKVFRYNNFSHSTLTVDDRLQRVDGFAPIIRHRLAGADGEGHTVIDMSEVYEGQLARALRGVKLSAGGSVLVQDEVRTREDGSGATAVRWVMATPGRLESTDRGQAVLEQDGRRLHLRLVGLEEPPVFRVWSLEPPNSWDAPNPGLRKVGFELEPAPGETSRWGVILTPGAATAVPGLGPPLLPLENWSPPLPEAEVESGTDAATE